LTVVNVAEAGPGTHPLLVLQAEVERDHRAPLDNEQYGHGSWDGRWSYTRQREWDVIGVAADCGRLSLRDQEDQQQRKHPTLVTLSSSGVLRSTSQRRSARMANPHVVCSRGNGMDLVGLQMCISPMM